MAAIATCIYELPDSIMVVCPHCEGIHLLPLDTGRLAPIPAACDGGKEYAVSATLKAKSLASTPCL